MSSAVAKPEKLSIHQSWHQTIPALLAVVCTTIDGILTFWEFDNHMIAEANGIWGTLFAIFPPGVVMGIRTLFGVLALIALWTAALYLPHHRSRRMATVGLWICGIVLTLVSIYHFVGIYLFFH